MARYKTKLAGVIYRDSTTYEKRDKTYYIRYKDNNGISRKSKSANIPKVCVRTTAIKNEMRF